MLLRTVRSSIALPELRKLIDALDGSIVAPVFSADYRNLLFTNNTLMLTFLCSIQEYVS